NPEPRRFGTDATECTRSRPGYVFSAGTPAGQSIKRADALGGSIDDRKHEGDGNDFGLRHGRRAGDGQCRRRLRTIGIGRNVFVREANARPGGGAHSQGAGARCERTKGAEKCVFAAPGTAGAAASYRNAASATDGAHTTGSGSGKTRSAGGRIGRSA